MQSELLCIDLIKEANLKKRHTVGFQLHDILEKAELCRQ